MKFYILKTIEKRNFTCVVFLFSLIMTHSVNGMENNKSADLFSEMEKLEKRDNHFTFQLKGLNYLTNNTNISIDNSSKDNKVIYQNKINFANKMRILNFKEKNLQTTHRKNKTSVFKDIKEKNHFLKPYDEELPEQIKQMDSHIKIRNQITAQTKNHKKENITEYDLLTDEFNNIKTLVFTVKRDISFDDFLETKQKNDKKQIKTYEKYLNRKLEKAISLRDNISELNYKIKYLKTQIGQIERSLNDEKLVNQTSYVKVNKTLHAENSYFSKLEVNELIFGQEGSKITDNFIHVKKDFRIFLNEKKGVPHSLTYFSLQELVNLNSYIKDLKSYCNGEILKCLITEEEEKNRKIEEVKFNY
jgi:hypothetical protein